MALAVQSARDLSSPFKYLTLSCIVVVRSMSCTDGLGLGCCPFLDNLLWQGWGNDSDIFVPVRTHTGAKELSVPDNYITNVDG